MATLWACITKSLSTWKVAMGRYRRKKVHVNNKTQKKKYRTKRRTKDMDQIQEDMLPGNAQKLTSQLPDPDLPGEGRFYCLHCARYFIDGGSMKKHFATKLHKRRLKALREPVYNHKEAEMAAGMGNYQLPLPPLEPKSKPRTVPRKKAPAMELGTDELGMRIGSLGIGTDGLGMRTRTDELGKRIRSLGKETVGSETEKLVEKKQNDDLDIKVCTDGLKTGSVAFDEINLKIESLKVF